FTTMPAPSTASAAPAGSGQEVRLFILIPKEYGAWAMLLMPLIMTLGVVGMGLSGLIYSIAVMGLYLARYPVELVVRRRTVPGLGRWFFIYVSVTGVLGLLLLAGYGLWGLLPLTMVAVFVLGLYLRLIRRRAERSAPAELVLVSGLSLTAAGAVYVELGGWTTLALWLWLLAALYSGSSVFFVRMMVRRPPQGGASLSRRLKLGKGAVFYQVFLWVGVLTMVVTGAVPPLVLVAFIPLLAKVVLGLFAVGGRPRIRVLGFMELGHTAIFALLMVAAYRWV
ncbi:MAG: YwiC-like family protein, partial [Dehalococcoidia bacterium]|nr:YwiC-like family protein [Dehalococcoidia bacterium]